MPSWPESRPDEEKWTRRIVKRVITRRRRDGDEISGNEKFSFSASRKRRLFIFINEVGSKEKEREREREEQWNKRKRSGEWYADRKLGMFMAQLGANNDLFILPFALSFLWFY